MGERDDPEVHTLTINHACMYCQRKSGEGHEPTPFDVRDNWHVNFSLVRRAGLGRVCLAMTLRPLRVCVPMQVAWVGLVQRASASVYGSSGPVFCLQVLCLGISPRD